MVFPHRRVGFADAAAPIPVYGWDLSDLSLRAMLAVDNDKVATGGTPVAAAALVMN